MKKKLITGTIFSLIVIIGLIAGIVCAKPQNKATTIFNQPVVEKFPVAIGKVERMATSVRPSYPGIVKACRTTKLAFRVGGPLIKVSIKPGDQVKKGNLLMQIDQRDFKNRIAVLEAELKSAQAVRDNAKQNFSRTETLYQQAVRSKADYDLAKSSHEKAAAIIDGIRANLKIAHDQLADTSLQAPYCGIITIQRTENYEIVKAGQVVLELQDISALEITVNVPENEIAKHHLDPGQKATVSFPAVAEMSFTAHLSEWNSEADPVTKTYRITFLLPAPEEKQILPGMTAELNWHDDLQKNSLLMSVPARAILTDHSGTPYVWIYNNRDATANKRAVVLSAVTGISQVILEKGVQEGETVVVEGGNFISENMKLKPTN